VLVDDASGEVAEMNTPTIQTKSRKPIWFWIDVSIVALALRLLLVPVAPYFGYPGDHDDFVRWGLKAVDDGITTLYDTAPPRMEFRIREEGQWTTTQRQFDRLCNYPPGSAYRLAISGWVFNFVGPKRLANTAASHYCFSVWAILADFITAAGCAAIVSRFVSGPGVRWTYALMLFLPPLWWDSVIWAQTDSMLLAPAVWMIWAMLARRWMLAGLLLGVAASMKPQAILFLPVWALAIATIRPRWKPLAGIGIAVASLLLIALPFNLQSGWAWWRASYWENLTSTYASMTTLKAFNVWYADLLLTLSDDAKAPLLGVTRDLWGKLLLAVALVATFVWAIVRWRGRERGVLLFAMLSLLACMMLPTQVHERYLVLVLPFLGVCAVIWPRLWGAFVPLTIVALAQVAWPIWMTTEPAAMKDLIEFTQAAHEKLKGVPTERLPEDLRSTDRMIAAFREEYRKMRGPLAPIEWTLTLVALASTAYAFGAAVTIRPDGRPPSG